MESTQEQVKKKQCGYCELKGKKCNCPVCEQCASCKNSTKKCSRYHKCDTCEENEFCGAGYNYNDKHFCSVLCMSFHREADIDKQKKITQQKKEEWEKKHGRSADSYFFSGGNVF